MIPIATKRGISLVVGMWLVLFLVLPMLWMGWLSCRGEAGFTWIHYQAALCLAFFKVLWRSLCLAMVATLVCFVIAYPFCYLLAQRKHRNLLLVMMVIPFWTSSLIRIYALIGLLKTRGLVNALLMHFGVIHQPLTLLYNQIAVVIGLSYDLLPFMMLPLYAGFERFEWPLLAAAQDLNASWWYRFSTIVWPLTLPAVKSSGVMVLFPAMTLFYVPNLLGGARSMLVGNYIENQFLLLNDWSGGAACSVVLTVMMLLMARLARVEVSA